MIKISQLPAASVLDGTELVPIVQASTTKQSTIGAIYTYVAAFFSASGGAALLGFLQGGTGAVATTLQIKVRESVSVFDFMTSAQIVDVLARTALLDITAAINAAVTYVNSLGGGTVYFPAGTYASSTGLTLGNGSNSAVSTVHNKIRLVGEGYGSSSAVTNQQVAGASIIKYTGSTSSATGVLTLAGPMYGVEIENLSLDCNAKAGRGLIVNHVTQSTFRRVSVRNPGVIGWELTTRTGFPSGCAFGCADNRFYDCYAWIDDASLSAATIRGIVLTSGVSSGTSLVSQPDSARNIFIGGTFMYGTTATSYGAWLNGADNNTLINVLLYPYGGSTSGFDVYFQQWAASGNFPLENYFSNVGMTVGVSGNGGVGSSYGNLFAPFSTSDGAPLPTITGASAITHQGQTSIQGVRAYQGRQISAATSQTPRSTSSGTYADITDYSVTLTTLAGYLNIVFAGNAAKATAGQGFYQIAVDTVAYGETQSEVYSTGGYGGVACSKLLAVTAGSHTVTIQFKSSDANATTLNNGTLTVQELF